MQLSHGHKVFNKRTLPIILVCDNVHKAANIGSLFRTADAFGIEKLIFCGENLSLGKRMSKTSRATEKVVVHDIQKSAMEVIDQLRKQDYLLIALEITSNSQSLHTYHFPKKPIALIIGNENHGVSDPVLAASDAVVHIEMYGHNSSMNVVQATSIALYEIAKQMRH